MTGHKWGSLGWPSGNDLGKTWEDNLVKYLGKGMPSNLYLLEKGIRNYKRRIAQDPSI